MRKLLQDKREKCHPPRARPFASQQLANHHLGGFFFFLTWRSSSRQGISQTRRANKKCAAQQTREQKLSVLRLEGGQMAQRRQEKSDAFCAKTRLLLLPYLCCYLERVPYSPLMSYPNLRCSSIFRNIIVSEHYSSFPCLFPLLHLCQHSCSQGPL